MGGRSAATALVAAVPHGHWTTLTFMAGLRHDGIVAPCVWDGPINGETFLAWVRHELAPTLRQGDVVVLDNLGSHKGQAVRRAIRKAGAHLLFLPPYSPDLNPIEMMFAKLKTLLRKADDDGRQREACPSYRLEDTAQAARTAPRSAKNGPDPSTVSLRRP
jgi:transposase